MSLSGEEYGRRPAFPVAKDSPWSGFTRRDAIVVLILASDTSEGILPKRGDVQNAIDAADVICEELAKASKAQPPPGVK